MKTLFLHVGCHKTGTTSIQSALLKNSELLLKKHIYFFHENTNKTLNSSGVLHDWISLEDFPHDPTKVWIRKPHLLAQRLAGTTSSTVVASSENFSFISKAKELAQLSSELEKHFDHIRIIFYLRRQDSHAISHHMEGASNQWAAEVSYYKGYNALPELRKEQFDYLDYYSRIMNWSNSFGKDNIIIRIYEPDQLHKGDAVSDFFHLLGIEGIQDIRKNVSKSFLKNIVGLTINNTLPPSFLNSWIRSSLRDGGRILPSQEQAIEYYENYKEANIKLNMAFTIRKDQEDIFNDNFSYYPLYPEDQWTQENYRNALEDLFKSIRPYAILNNQDIGKTAKLLEDRAPLLSKKYSALSNALKLKGEVTSTASDYTTLAADADHLRDLAISLENEDPELACRLLKRAHKLRPKGTRISRKLKSLERLLNVQKAPHAPKTDLHKSKPTGDTDVKRYLQCLSELYKLDPTAFQAAEEIQDSHRAYFTKSTQDLKSYDASLSPKNIPFSPYWAVTNIPKAKKKKILELLVSQYDVSQEAKENLLKM